MGLTRLRGNLGCFLGLNFLVPFDVGGEVEPAWIQCSHSPVRKTLHDGPKCILDKGRVGKDRRKYCHFTAGREDKQKGGLCNKTLDALLMVFRSHALF